MATPTVNIPNEVLDLETLRAVRASVAKRKVLIQGKFSTPVEFLGIPLGTRVCAVGALLEDAGITNVYDVRNMTEFDPFTLAHVIGANDIELEHVSPRQRRDAMLNFLDRAIAYAENVAKEVETLASSGPSVAHELQAA